MLRRIFLILVIVSSLTWLGFHVAQVLGKKRAVIASLDSQVTGSRPADSQVYPNSAPPAGMAQHQASKPGSAATSFDPPASATPDDDVLMGDSPASPDSSTTDYVPHSVIAQLIAIDGGADADSAHRLAVTVHAAGLDARLVGTAVLVTVPGSVLADTEQRARLVEELRPFVRRSRTTLLVPSRFIQIAGSIDHIEQLRQQIETHSGTKVRPRVYEPVAPVPEASTGIEVVLIPR
jgi:hypothetical protein